jgi:hypothetical protein
VLVIAVVVDFKTCHRCPVLSVDNNDGSNPITVIVVLDASGLTITKKGDYIEQKWIRKKKEFIKPHIVVDER